MATIIQTADNTYTASNGKGTELMLTKKDGGYWEVMAQNAATRAYRTLGVKIFWTLDEVEKSYKTFRGLASLIA